MGVAQYLTGTGASYQGEDVRAVGTFGATDVMGMATVVSYGLVVVTGIALGSGPGRARTAALVCAGLLFLPLVLSFSRGAWIATVLACALQLLLAGPRRAVWVALAAGALGVVLVGGLGIGSELVEERVASITRVTAAPDQSVTDRYTMWAAAGEMWRAEPLTGVGLKGFPQYRDAHASVALSSGSDTAGAGAGFQRQPLLSPHNMYLLVLSEQGLWAARAGRELDGAARGRAAAARRLRPRVRCGRGLRARRDGPARLAARRLLLRGHRRPLDGADGGRVRPGGLVVAGGSETCVTRGRGTGAHGRGWPGPAGPVDPLRSDGPHPVSRSPRPPCGTPPADPWSTPPLSPTDSPWGPGPSCCRGGGLRTEEHGARTGLRARRRRARAPCRRHRPGGSGRPVDGHPAPAPAPAAAPTRAGAGVRRGDRTQGRGSWRRRRP